jgi:TRAP-type mannitol/chloroaromatic compound transport system substrate-binding protein
MRYKVLLASFAAVALIVGAIVWLTPSQAQGPIVLKMQSTWPSQDIFHQTFVDWAKKTEEMSGGRLKIELLPSGAVVPAFQLIDAVHQGTLDGGHGLSTYWYGKHVAASLFGTGPSFGLDAEALLAWIYYGGGQQLYNELIQKILKLDVVSFFHGPMPTQPFGWFKKAIARPNDIRGIKFRTVGLSAELYKKMGASVVILPVTEIILALDRGVIDAAEFYNPSSDRLLGFPDVRKVLMAQSYHQPVEFLELMFNKKKYESLPKDLQAIIKYAAMAESADFTWKMMDRNSKDLEEMKTKHGVKVVRTPKSVLQAQLKAWDEIIAENLTDPFSVKVLESQKAWAARVGALRLDIMVENETAYNHYFKAKAAAASAPKPAPPAAAKPAAPAAKPAEKKK